MGSLTWRTTHVRKMGKGKLDARVTREFSLLAEKLTKRSRLFRCSGRWFRGLGVQGLGV